MSRRFLSQTLSLSRPSFSPEPCVRLRHPLFLRKLRRIFRHAVLTLCALPLALFAQESVQVVTTIKPLHSLVSGVMAGIDEPHLLLRGATSPHTFSLRPSDASKLQDADLVFYICGHLETSLMGPISNLADNARIVELTSVGGLVRRTLRVGGAFEEHDHATHGGEDDQSKHATGHDDEDEHGEHATHVESHASAEQSLGHEEHSESLESGLTVHMHDHDHAEYDPHIWLDPVNAMVMIRHIANALSIVDPNNADTYGANAAEMIPRLEALNAQIAADMSTLQDQPFIVFHDGYRYFEDRYGLTAVGSTVVSPDRTPGARRIRELQDKIASLNVRCVFSEPQFAPRVVRVITRGTDAGMGEVDPLGAKIDDGPELYFTLMQEMSKSFKDCLSS